MFGQCTYSNKMNKGDTLLMKATDKAKASDVELGRVIIQRRHWVQFTEEEA